MRNEERSDEPTSSTSALKKHTRWYFRKRRDSSITTAINLTHNPNPFTIRFAHLSLNPPLSAKDKKNVEEIVKLLSFLQGRGGGNSGGVAGVRESINQLTPVVSEFRNETRDFVIQLILRLSEKRVARGLKYLGGGGSRAAA